MTRRQAQNDIERDIQEHIEIETRDNIERGMSPEEARFAALRKFGNVARIQEETRAVWTWTRLDQVLQDVRYALRTLRRNPGFAAVAVLTLALGIGMNTAVFSVVNAVLLRPVPYPNPERLVWIANYNERFKMEAVAGPDFLDWRAQAQSFESMTAYSSGDATVFAGESSQQARVAATTPGFWKITAVRPALGRLFGPDDRDVMVLTDSLFDRQFHRDPSVVGKPVTLAGRAVTVIGVLPRSFRFVFPATALPGTTPKEIEAFRPGDWTPANQVRGRNMAILYVIGKLKPGIPLEHGFAEIKTIQARIASANPQGFYDVVQLRVIPLGEKLVGNARGALLVLLAAVAFVLLIACANIANLLLARATVRQKEIAIRAAVGAGRARLLRQFLFEGIALALLGGVAGLVLARWAVALLIRLGPLALPRLTETSIDGRVLAFTFALAVAAAILFGLGPALASSQARLHEVLKDAARTVSSGAAVLRGRGLLAASEIALALVLLTGAGLMMKSLWRLNAHPPGFEPEHVLALRVSLSGPAYRQPEAQTAYMEQLLARIQGVPGVQAVGIASPPLWGTIDVENAPPFPPGQAPMTNYNTLSAGYARALGMTLLKGRWMTDTETSDVVLINDTLARRVFGNENPIGKRIRIPHGTPPPIAAIVGVVGDLKYSKLDADPGLEVYIPYRQSPSLRTVDVAVRASGDPISLAPAVRKLISGIDPTQPVFDMKTMDQALSESIAPRRFNLLLLGIFAGTAVLLALVGIYGVMSYAVTQRTHEIGVRMALGARQSEVVGMVVRQGMTVALAGIAAGLAAAYGLTRLIATLLYDVKPNDPATFVAVSIILAAAALLACSLPARRAARVDPIVALRYE
jgi:putative ABC transport system permease protein